MWTVKKILPSQLYRMVSTFRTWNRSQIKDQMFKRLHPAALQQKHLNNVEMVPSRAEFLQRMPKGGTCAEVGVAEGEFSRMILDNMQPTKLVLIDLWSPDSKRYSKSMEIAQKQVQPEIDGGVVEIKRGWSWEMLETLDNESLDWVYIDADHEYEGVRRDLEVVGRKIKKSGIIAGHDYTRWSSQGINRWGVVEAVNEFCIDNDWEIRFLTAETHRHLSFALQAIENSGNP
jgi:predicted O-methyltransferase YrrM